MSRVSGDRARGADIKRRKRELKSRKTKRLLFESLEQRMLLASDFLFDATA